MGLNPLCNSTISSRPNLSMSVERHGEGSANAGNQIPNSNVNLTELGRPFSGNKCLLKANNPSIKLFSDLIAKIYCAIERGRQP